MKKILSLAVLLAALCASAETDMYLYWMLDEGATVGGAALDSTESYYAKVKISGGDYLNFYDTVGGASKGQMFAIQDVADTMPVLSGVFADNSAQSFIIELYQAGTGVDDGTLYGTAALAWNYDYITSNGTGYANAANVTTFTAVPEPTSGLLLLLGVAGLALRRKKMQKA